MCFYGQPDANKRKEVSNMLLSFKPAIPYGWCVLRYFNEIVTNKEKEGGRPRKEYLMSNFRDVLEKGELHDIGWKGYRFT